MNSIKIINLEESKDFRGKYIESFNTTFYKRFSIKTNFIQDDFSFSKKNVLRGFHGDHKTWKLFFCVKGKVQFAFINYDIKSKNYLDNVSFTVDENKPRLFLVPPKHGTAHLVLSEFAVINYKQSTLYGKYKQFSINYKSKCLKFKWKYKNPIVSKRDKNAIILE